jgi:hypothetical protein
MTTNLSKGLGAVQAEAGLINWLEAGAGHEWSALSLARRAVVQYLIQAVLSERIHSLVPRLATASYLR